jgi:hypothetical protein
MNKTIYIKSRENLGRYLLEPFLENGELFSISNFEKIKNYFTVWLYSYKDKKYSKILFYRRGLNGKFLNKNSMRMAKSER